MPLVYGWSMGGQQALHWGAIFPDRVERIIAVCTSARTSPHNKVFLEGIRAVLTADASYRDGRFNERPVASAPGLRRVYAGWAMSQAFYREELWRGIGYTSLEDYLVRDWEGNFLRRTPEDLLSMLDTWMQSDISDNPIYRGDLGKALGAITAQVYHHAVDHGSLLHAGGQRDRDAANAERRVAADPVDLGPSGRQPALFSRRRGGSCGSRTRYHEHMSCRTSALVSPAASYHLVST